MKLKSSTRTSLLAATILSVSFTVEARESFYNLRNTQPSISINLGALGNLEQTSQNNGSTLNNGGAPAAVAHPVYDNNATDPLKNPATKPLHVKEPPALKSVAKAQVKAAEEPEELVVKPPTGVSQFEETRVIVSKPVVDLPPTPPISVMPAPVKAPQAVSPPPALPQILQTAPGPKYVVSEPRENVKPEINKDIPKPAIVPEVAKVPLPPTAESEALHGSDKVVSLPPISDATKDIAKPTEIMPPVLVHNDLTPPPRPKLEAKPIVKAAPPKLEDIAPLPPVAEAKPKPTLPKFEDVTPPPPPAVVAKPVAKSPAPKQEDIALPPVPKVVEFKPAVKLAPSKPEDIATPPLMEAKPVAKPAPKPEDITPPPVVEAKLAVKPAPLKSPVSANGANTNINVATPNYILPEEDSPADEPPAPVKAKKISEVKTEVKKALEPKPVIPVKDNSVSTPEKSAVAANENSAPPPAAKPITMTFTPPPAPVSKRVVAPVAIPPQPTALKTLTPESPQSTAANPLPENLEKPSIHDLPPLSSLYDNKPSPAESLPPAATMPSKDAVMVQPQPQPLNTPPTKAAAANSGSSLTIVYAEAETDLPGAEKTHLDAIASQLTANKQARVVVTAYASGTPDQASQAKRTALARALAVRSYLLEHNISAERMDIKPLGNKSESGVPDRVDVIVEKSDRS